MRNVGSHTEHETNSCISYHQRFNGLEFKMPRWPGSYQNRISWWVEYFSTSPVHHERWSQSLATGCLTILLLTYCPSCHRQLGQQQILSISGDLEPMSVRFPMTVPWLSPQPQQYVSMSFLDARVSLVSISTATLGMEPWSLRNIWPIHFQRLHAIVVSILSCWHSSKRYW